MKAKTKNKLKAIVAKSNKEQIKEVMLTYNWNTVKFITVKDGDNTLAAIRAEYLGESVNILKAIDKEYPNTLKGRLAIFAYVRQTDFNIPEEENRAGHTYGQYFGRYRDGERLTVFA